MSIKGFIKKIKDEVKVLQGEKTKDKIYTNENVYADQASADQAFKLAKQKLFDINNWTNLKGISSSFKLYDQFGHPSNAKHPQVGYFVEIVLPGSNLDNWVQITDISETDTMAEFTVHPSEKPEPIAKDDEVKHFFIKEASSTFRVARNGLTLTGYEIGRNEGINNQGEEAGDRAMLNTVVAEGGWALFQEIQWDKLTKYLVHLEETEA